MNQRWCATSIKTGLIGKKWGFSGTHISVIIAKIQIYIVARAELLYPLCSEIPCMLFKTTIIMLFKASIIKIPIMLALQFMFFKANIIKITIMLALQFMFFKASIIKVPIMLALQFMFFKATGSFVSNYFEDLGGHLKTTFWFC